MKMKKRSEGVVVTGDDEQLRNLWGAGVMDVEGQGASPRFSISRRFVLDAEDFAGLIEAGSLLGQKGPLSPCRRPMQCPAPLSSGCWCPHSTSTRTQRWNLNVSERFRVLLRWNLAPRIRLPGPNQDVARRGAPVLMPILVKRGSPSASGQVGCKHSALALVCWIPRPSQLL